MTTLEIVALCVGIAVGAAQLTQIGSQLAASRESLGKAERFRSLAERVSQALRKYSFLSLAILIVALAAIVSSVTARKVLDSQRHIFDQHIAASAADRDTLFLVLTAEQALQKGNYHTAIEKYRAVFGEHRKHYFIEKRLGDCFKKLAKRDEATKEAYRVRAEHHYRESYRLNQKFPGTIKALANLLSRMSKFEDSAQIINLLPDLDAEALYIQGKNFLLWWKSAKAFEEDWYYQQARDVLRKCQAKEGQSWSSWCFYDEAALLALSSPWQKSISRGKEPKSAPARAMRRL